MQMSIIIIFVFCVLFFVYSFYDIYKMRQAKKEIENKVEELKKLLEEAADKLKKITK